MIEPQPRGSMSEDERETLLETIARQTRRIMELEGTVNRWTLALTGIASCSTCDCCRNVALKALTYK